MPSITTNRATKHATLAGVGTTSSLVAAVLAVAAVATSVVTFTAWPDAPPRDPAPVLQMQRGILTHTAEDAQPIALAGRGGLAPLGSAGSGAGRSLANGIGAASAQPLGGRAVGVNAPARSAGGASDAQQQGKPPVKSTGDGLSPVIDATSKASGSLATGVKSGGTAAGEATRKLSPVVGDAVNNVSVVTGEAVQKAGAAVEQIVRGLGGALGG